MPKPNRHLAAILILALLALFALPVSPRDGVVKVRPFKREPSEKALKWANDQLRKMSLDEKIGQLISVGLNATFLNQDSDAYSTLKHYIKDDKVGGLILFRGPVYESVILVNRMQQLAHYPLLISADLEAGAGMRFDDTVNFPWNMAVGATGNPEYARRQGEITAREARDLRWIFTIGAHIDHRIGGVVVYIDYRREYLLHSERTCFTRSHLARSQTAIVPTAATVLESSPTDTE